ncbi:unnamed protein product [Vicia faba]|uniref:Uncharacterized protein n=1 Tax=Vicia faba TaxID=3906 RepID=A0AAV1AYW5_VICFA|nr:unnamed protein product [Vicia faba]
MKIPEETHRNVERSLKRERVLGKKLCFRNTIIASDSKLQLLNTIYRPLASICCILLDIIRIEELLNLDKMSYSNWLQLEIITVQFNLQLPSVKILIMPLWIVNSWIGLVLVNDAIFLCYAGRFMWEFSILNQEVLNILQCFEIGAAIISF